MAEIYLLYNFLHNVYFETLLRIKKKKSRYATVET